MIQMAAPGNGAAIDFFFWRRIIANGYYWISQVGMMNRYIELLTVSKWRRHRGLDNAAELMKRIGDPQKKLRCIHVAGTNGKGSAAAYIASVLKAAGYKVGLNTSPYLQVFNERIKINGENIPDEAIDRYFPGILDAAQQMEEMPNEFGMITALAFTYFAEEHCDIAVVEVGMGGIDDATNVIEDPVCSVLMNIGYDHTSALGNTLPEIAEKKAGIIKKGRPAVVYGQSSEVMDVFRSVCEKESAPYIPVDFGKLSLREYSIDGQVFDYGELRELKTPLLGDHQLNNAAMAIEAIKCACNAGFKVDEGALRRGIENVFWPARFEVVNRKPLMIIDGGHNGQCAETTRKCIEKYLPGKKVTLITGIMRDKDAKKVFDAISPVAEKYVCVSVPDLPRAMEPERLADELKAYSSNVTYFNDLREGVELTMSRASEDEVIVVFGSLYLAGAVRNILKPVK